MKRKYAAGTLISILTIEEFLAKGWRFTGNDLVAPKGEKLAALIDDGSIKTIFGMAGRTYKIRPAIIEYWKGDRPTSKPDPKWEYTIIDTGRKVSSLLFGKVVTLKGTVVASTGRKLEVYSDSSVRVGCETYSPEEIKRLIKYAQP